MHDFTAYFQGHEDKLRADLKIIRSRLTHKGNKGSSAEDAFRSFLSDHLPRIYEVGHGEVIDSGDRAAGSIDPGAGQIDIIVLNDEQPRFVKTSDPGTYLIEGVSAAGEVKSILTSSELDKTVKKAGKFKSLRPKFFQNDMIQAEQSDVKRFYERRPYFLFAFESQMTIQTIHENIIKSQKKYGLTDTGHIDAVFCLDRGCLFNLGDGEGAFSFNLKSGAKFSNWGFKSEESTIVWLIKWLSVCMPRVRTFKNILTHYIFPQKD